jgi:hypothetical protein
VTIWRGATAAKGSDICWERPRRPFASASGSNIQAVNLNLYSVSFRAQGAGETMELQLSAVCNGLFTAASVA